MYLPAQFKSKDDIHAWALMRAHPFAQLTSVDDAGFPFVTHLPIHLETAGETTMLLGHVARGNPHWRYLQARPEALVVFSGPHAYMSPQVYPDLTRVPTWSYLAVHVRVTTRLVESPACIVVDEGDMSGHLARLLKQAGQDAPKSLPTLEVNAAHALVKRLERDERFDDLAQIIFDQALLAEGGHLEDPAAYVQRVNRLLAA